MSNRQGSDAVEAETARLFENLPFTWPTIESESDQSDIDDDEEGMRIFEAFTELYLTDEELSVEEATAAPPTYSLSTGDNYSDPPPPYIVSQFYELRTTKKKWENFINEFQRTGTVVRARRFARVPETVEELEEVRSNVQGLREYYYEIKNKLILKRKKMYDRYCKFICSYDSE